MPCQKPRDTGLVWKHEVKYVHESLWIKQPCQLPQNTYRRLFVDVMQEAVDEDEVEPAIALAGVIDGRLLSGTGGHIGGART